MGTFGVKTASEEKLCPRTLQGFSDPSWGPLWRAKRCGTKACVGGLTDLGKLRKRMGTNGPV